jgi:GcrA cell cycle regulator
MDLLRELWPTHTRTECAEILGTSPNSIIGKAHRLMLPEKEHRGGRAIDWDGEPGRVAMRGYHERKPMREIAREIGCDKSTLRRFYKSRGLATDILPAVQHTDHGSEIDCPAEQPQRRPPTVKLAPNVAPKSQPQPVVVRPPTLTRAAAPPCVAPPVYKTCHWPIGEPGTPRFRFCEAPEVVAGKPYCREHCQVAYFRAIDRKGPSA